MLTVTQRREAIEQIRNLPAQLEALVRPLSNAQLTTRYLENEWTVAQNVHHLLDSHMNSIIRMKLLLTEEHPTLRPYDQDAWAALPDACSAEIQPALAALAGLHRRWVDLLEQVPDTAWQRSGYHPETGVVTLDDLLHYYGQHGLMHLEQIRRTLAAGGG